MSVNRALLPILNFNVAVSKQVVVVDVTDAKWGQIPVAVVVADDDIKTTDILLPLEGQLAP